MPKPTFENLPAAKRQAIIEIAIAEFAEHPYNLASVSRIVERAGIAKGSLYQYFANKQDLFLHLIDHAAQAQLALLRDLTPPDPRLGFFELLRWQMGVSAQVGAAAPQLVRLMARATADDLPFREAAAAQLQQASGDHIEQMLRAGIAAGELDPALDPALAALMIRSLSGDIGRLIAQGLGLSMADVAADPSRLRGPEAEQIYDKVIAILRHGMGRRGD